MMLTAIKPAPEIVAIPLRWLPSTLTFEHFIHIFRMAPFHLYLINSLLIASVCTVSDVFIGALVGYGFADFRFAGSNLLFAALLSGLMIPFSVRLLNGGPKGHGPDGVRRGGGEPVTRCRPSILDAA